MSEQPTLVLMTGPPGAGKTTLALALTERLGWPTIDKDTLKSTMLTVGIGEEPAGPASYELMLALGCDLLGEQRLSTILDSPAGYPVIIERAEAIARDGGGLLRVILCLAPQVERNRRLGQRPARPSQWRADTTILDDGRERWAPLLPAGSLVLDMTRPLAEIVREAVAYVRG